MKPTEKKWYAIKKKSEKRWAAYEIDEDQIKLLKSNYQRKGPFDSLAAALSDAIVHNEKYYPKS